MTVNGASRYVYRAIDQHGQVVDVLVSARRDAAAARRSFARALRTLTVTSSEVIPHDDPSIPDDELVRRRVEWFQAYTPNAAAGRGR